MKFLFPSGAWLLLVLAGIIAIYLLRMPRRRLQVADIAPWLTVARAGKRISSERRTLISLLLQSAIVLSLILAFTRPYFAAGDSRFELVLIDLSRSTAAHDLTTLKILEGVEKPVNSGPSRLDIQKDALLKMVRGMNPGDRMTIIGVGERPSIVASSESESTVLERCALGLEPRNESAAFAPACQLAVELAKSEKNIRVTLICDGSVDQKELAALNGLPAGAGKIRCVTSGQPAENIGITSFKSRKKFNSSEIDSTITLVSSAKQAVKVPVELYLDGKVQRATIAEIAPGGTQVVNFQMDYRFGGVLKARLALQDALQDDNEAIDFLPAPHRMKVALVTRNPMDEKAANEYYLARVLRADTGVDGGFLAAADYEKIASDKKALKTQFEAVIFDNWVPATDSLPECHALFVNAESPDIPVSVKELVGERPLIRKWDEGHPLMNYLNLRDVFLKKAKVIQLNDPTTDVVTELVSSPLILARETGHRKLAYIGFNPADSDIQFKKELPLFVLNCFEWFKRGAEPVTQIAPGEPLSIPVTDSTWKALLVTTPEGGTPRKIEIPAGAESVMFYDTYRPGTYRVMGDSEKSATRGFAVYFGSAKESDLNTKPLQITSNDEAGKPGENRAESTTLDALVEHHVSAGMWLYFAALALVLLVAENYFFHRRVFF
jgi:hypothetical protein